MLPLEGITVVSIEQAVAGPFATRQLADLGARVIKIERPETGDFARHYDSAVNGMASHFVWINRSKESLTLDLKTSEGKAVLSKLLEDADVFLQNLAPGAMERLGFGSNELLEKYSQLIICNISGYGSNGPYTNKKAYDLLVQCESGAIAITGTNDTPSKSGIAIADIATAMYAYSGILSALLARNKDKKGRILEVSMLESVGEWMGFPAYFAEYGGKEPERTGASHATIYPYGPFLAGDQKQVFIGIQNEREWKNFCEKVINHPELTNHPDYYNNINRFKNQETLQQIIEDVFCEMTSETIIELLEESGIANARLNSVMDFVHHPQLKARNRWREVDSPVGKLKALLPPVTFHDMEPILNPIPALGQHTEDILKSVGYTEEEIKRLTENKII